jgi:(2R)-sulfolactate sulfo-lyase subunit alpha
MAEHKFLIHNFGDDVGVAVTPIKAGETVLGIALDNKEKVTVTANHDIPLGHKIALANKKAGDDLVKYGIVVGEVTEDFVVGDWVHTHNLRTKRWNYGN